jgi:hypothetical protein
MIKIDKGNDFDDFGEMASEKMGDSMISNKSDKAHFIQSHEQIVSYEKIEEKAEKPQEEEKGEEKEEGGNDFDDFGEMASEKMGDSMISNKSDKAHFIQSHEQIVSYEKIDEKAEKSQEAGGNDFDDFGEMASEKMGDSMISNKSDKAHFIQSHEQIVSDEKIEEKAEKPQEEEKGKEKEEGGNDFDDFGEMASEKMGDSMISNKSDKAHFIQSHEQIVSYEKIEEKAEKPQEEEKGKEKEEGGNDFDDFGEMASEKMGDSMISNKSDKAHFIQSHEQIVSYEKIEEKAE